MSVFGEAAARLLVGRTIASVEMRPFDNGKGGRAFDPVITLDNGARLTLSTQETEVGEYGVQIAYHAKRGRP